MQTVKSQLLFVYGTLRPQLVGRVTTAAPAGLVKRLTAVGEATVPGLLIDLGAYPGFVPATSGREHRPEHQQSAPLVAGDLLEVDERQLATFDAYEECGGQDPLYRRERTTATRRRDGSRVECWIYRYCRDITGRQVIASGDYAQHLADH